MEIKQDGHSRGLCLPELCLRNENLECNRFLLHYPGKNEFIIFISPFLIKSLMPISHPEQRQISHPADIRRERSSEQHTVGLRQINSLEMENIRIWLTSSLSDINPLHRFAKMSFGCDQGPSFVLWAPASHVPGHWGLRLWFSQAAAYLIRLRQRTVIPHLVLRHVLTLLKHRRGGRFLF